MQEFFIIDLTLNYYDIDFLEVNYMADYKQIGLFDDSFIEDESEEDIIDTYREYTLVQDPIANDDDTFNYKVFDDYGILVKRYKAKIDAQDLTYSEYQTSNIRKLFITYVNSAYSRKKSETTSRSYPSLTKSSKSNYYDDEDDDDSFYRYEPKKSTYTAFSNYSDFYKPKPKSTGFLDKLNKSNTLVVHCADKSTDMLAQVYEGKGWDVLRDGNIDKDELHKLIESHDRLIFLGHGTSSGLINVQGGGTVIGPTEAPLLKDKNIFAIWCNADKYFKQHNIGHGCFITKNVPSEVWEAAAVGYHVSAPWMLENITYWSKCCADVVEQALNGDVKGAVEKARAAYQEKYGDDPNPNQKGVTDYNTDAIQVQP